jgi:hypothetical protein
MTSYQGKITPVNPRGDSSNLATILTELPRSTTMHHASCHSTLRNKRHTIIAKRTINKHISWIPAHFTSYSIACVVDMMLSHNQTIHYKSRVVIWRKHRNVRAWSGASVAVYMGSAPFWGFTQHTIVASYRRFGTTYQVPYSNIGRRQTSVRTCHYPLSKTPEQGRSQEWYNRILTLVCVAHKLNAQNHVLGQCRGAS